MKLFVQEVSG